MKRITPKQSMTKKYKDTRKRVKSAIKHTSLKHSFGKKSGRK